MKGFLLIAVAVFIGTRGFAEEHISPEINMHYSGFSQYNVASQNIHFSPRLGFKIGFNIDSVIAGNFTAQVGIFLTMKGASHEEYGDNYSLRERVSLNYFEYPLNFGYRFITDKRGYFFVTTGPFMRLGLWGKYESHAVVDNVVIDKSTTKMFNAQDDRALYKLLDYGWNFGAGYMLPFGLYCRMEYGIDLANIAKAASSKARNIDGFGVTIGYNINRFRERYY